MPKLFACLIAIGLLMGLSIAGAGQSKPDYDKMTALAEQAYFFAYPLVIMEASEVKMTSAGNTVNQLRHMRQFPDHTFVDVVTPNADTLYTMVWLDLRQGAQELTLPDVGDRYYVFQCLDAWTNVFVSLGSRTTGNKEGVYLFTGPGWQGEVPQGVVHIVSPTSMVWILGRTETNGKSDYQAVHAIQDAFRLRSLPGGYSLVPQPAFAAEVSVPPVERVDALSAEEFFAVFNRLLADNPPAAVDAPLMRQLEDIGVAPGKPFVLANMPPETSRAITAGFARAREKHISSAGQSLAVVRNGWSILPPTVGDYGTDYSLRALVARVGLGANLPEDAVYPNSRRDSQGRVLSGSERYVIHFAKEQLPPVKGFWSISMYDEKQRFVYNPIQRYAIGSYDSLVMNEDGSLDIYIQHETPGAGKEMNWLPAPAGVFNIFMRLYWPDQTVLDGTWPMPELRRIS